MQKEQNNFAFNVPQLILILKFSEKLHKRKLPNETAHYTVLIAAEETLIVKCIFPVSKSYINGCLPQLDEIN